MIVLARVAGLLACVLVLTGCVSREGIILGKQPYINEHFAEYAALPPGAELVESDDDEPVERSSIDSVIVIGKTSAYREIEADEAAREYEKYRKQYKKAWGLESEPLVSLEAFSETIAGWTRIKVVGIPLLVAGYVKALVPESIVDDVTFEHTAATILLQTSSDLVAAQTNADGAFEIVAVLCKDEFGISECDADYKRGVFDVVTGREVKSKLVLKEDGDQIDPLTYRLVEHGE